MIVAGHYLTYVQRFLPILLLAAFGAALTQASSVQTISIDLSPLHTGSVLSGSVTLQTPLALGDSVLIPLSFTDPFNYSPATLTTTLSVTAGTPTDQFRFSTISFTNIANNRTYNLMVRGAAACAVDFPCQATGGYEANSPPAFSGTYTVTSAPSPVPEPGYGMAVAAVLVTIAVGRRSSLQFPSD